jgi:hypothetical protein
VRGGAVHAEAACVLGVLIGMPIGAGDCWRK